MLTFINKLLQRKKPLISDWEISNPTCLWFAGKPTKSGEFVAAKLTPLSEIESALSATWTEVILGDAKVNRQIAPQLKITVDELPVVSRDEYISRLKMLSENCVIRWLDDDMRWVITLRPGKRIPKGFVTCYTGIATIISYQQSALYSDCEYLFNLFKSDREEAVVDAKNYGNMGRIFPFLLEEEHLINFNLDSSIKNKIAVANLKFKLAVFNGMRMPCVFADEDIVAPFDRELLLGLNYSIKYLYQMQRKNNQFKLVNKDSFIQLSSDLYPQKVIEVKLEGLEYAFSISRLRIVTAKYFSGLEHVMFGSDEQKGECYKIVVPDDVLYQALMDMPEADVITVKPEVIKISYDDYVKNVGLTA